MSKFSNFLLVKRTTLAVVFFCGIFFSQSTFAEPYKAQAQISATILAGGAITTEQNDNGRVQFLKLSGLATNSFDVLGANKAQLNCSRQSACEIKNTAAISKQRISLEFE